MSDFLKEQCEVIDELTEIGVRVVRLTSGEELICKIFNKNENTYAIKKSAILLPTEKPGHLAMAPWCPYVKTPNGIEISKDKVMFIAEPVEDMYNEYNSAFGSGLITAPAGMNPNDIIGNPDLKLTK